MLLHKILPMCFPNTLSQIDFFDSQLSENELIECIEQYKNAWVDEIGQFQLSEAYMTSGQTRRCNLIDCLPKELKDRFYAKYWRLIGMQGKGRRLF